jgi:histidinol-phosphate aminotransferase
MTSVLHLARADIRELQPYQHASWDPALERMHANEMPWRAKPDASAAGLNRYPEPQPRELVARMARLYGVTPEQVLVGRGSDEGIDLLVRAFCRAGSDSVVITPPTFGFYKVAARVQGASVLEVPLCGADFELATQAVIAAGRQAKIVFLCSPNNPTGNLLDDSAMLRILTELDGQAIVCVDEAYIEFADRGSLTTRLQDFGNLVILRTLSKAYALAGARLGTLIANPEIVGLLRRIIPPYAIPTSTIEEVLACTDESQRQTVTERISTLLAEREVMRQRLARLPHVLRVHCSDANFLLVRFADATQALRAGQMAGLIVRDFSKAPALDGCLRISIGTPDQNQRLMTALERL